jgi:hypothetical protein
MFRDISFAEVSMNLLRSDSETLEIAPWMGIEGLLISLNGFGFTLFSFCLSKMLFEFDLNTDNDFVFSLF